MRRGRTLADPNSALSNHWITRYYFYPFREEAKWRMRLLYSTFGIFEYVFGGGIIIPRKRRVRTSEPGSFGKENRDG